MKSIDEIKLYRITHIENIPHILKYGITHKRSKKYNPNYINIGDSSLINTREIKKVDVTNGSDLPINSLTLGDFTPFYFGVKMPMLFVIQLGGNFVGRATPPEEIIYLVCSLKKVAKTGNDFYFTDGHATDSLTTFYDSSMFERILEIINWKAVNAQYWGGDENLEVKRKKQAEFLVKGDLPTQVIEKYFCFNEKAKNKLISFGIKESVIEIEPNAYY